MSEPKQVVLDASSLIVLLKKEKGWEKVAAVMPMAIMSSVNIAEVAKYLIEHDGFSKEMAKTLLEKLLGEVIDFDSEQAYTSAELRIHAKAYGLSLGDRACLALALTNGYNVYTSDKAWSKLKLEGVRIELLR